MTVDTELCHKRIVEFLGMPAAKKEATIDSSRLFPNLPHDSGSRDALDLESNVLLCMAVELNDYYISAMIAGTDAETDADRRLRAIQAYLSLLINSTFQVLESEDRLLSCWTKQGINDDEWIGLSILSEGIFPKDEQIAESLVINGDDLFCAFVPDKGSLKYRS